MAPLKIGLVGAGNVSLLYLPNLVRAPGLEIVAIADLDATVARARAAEYGIATVLTPDQIIEHPEIELILNFTPIPAHVATTRRALEGGKHVYSEKPLATTTADALSLLQEADHRRRRLGCAPDTLLGSGLQAARSALASGSIGRTLGADAIMFRGAIPKAGYATGDIAFFDMAPYYVTTLVTLLGPARRVVGLAQTLTAAEAGTALLGASISFGAVLEFDDRRLATLLLSWGTDGQSEVPAVHVYGTTGDLEVPNPNLFGEAASVRPYGGTSPRLVEGSVQPADWPRQQRGLGVAEMAEAIRGDRPPRVAGDLAAHVVEVMEGVVTAIERGQPIDITTGFEPPPPLGAADRARLLGR